MDHVLVASALVEPLRPPRVVVHHAVARTLGVLPGEQAVAVQAHVHALRLVAPLDAADRPEARGCRHPEAQVAGRDRRAGRGVEVQHLAGLRVAQHGLPVAELYRCVTDVHVPRVAGGDQHVVGQRPDHRPVRAAREEVLPGLVRPALLHEVAEEEDTAARLDVLAQRVPVGRAQVRGVQPGLHEQVAHRPVNGVGTWGDVPETVFREAFVGGEVVRRVRVAQVRVDDDRDHGAAPLKMVELATRSSRAAARSQSDRSIMAAVSTEYARGLSTRS